MQAQDVMTPWVATIGADATVQEAAKLMIERGISALPVVDARDRVVRIVREGDLARRRELGTDAPRSWWLSLFAADAASDYVKTHGRAVGDVMNRLVVSVRRATPLKEIARLLEKHRIKRVPVLRKTCTTSSCNCSSRRTERRRRAIRPRLTYVKMRRHIDDMLWRQHDQRLEGDGHVESKTHCLRRRCRACRWARGLRQCWQWCLKPLCWTAQPCEGRQARGRPVSCAACSAVHPQVAAPGVVTQSTCIMGLVDCP
jgi:CBS domain-containing protein